jgi:hypothetical protein
MPLLNEADEIYLGSDPAPADKIYVGDTEIWVATRSAAQFSPVFTILQVISKVGE